MIDRGLGVDISPLFTLQSLKVSIYRIWYNNVCVWDFDSAKWDEFGEIDLILMIGPVEFRITF